MKFRVYGEDAVITNRREEDIEAIDLIEATALAKDNIFNGRVEDKNLETKINKTFSEVRVKGTYFRIRILSPCFGKRFPFSYNKSSGKQPRT